MPLSPDADLSVTLECPVLRLRLRAWTPDDAADIIAACADPTIQTWLPNIPAPYTAADAEGYLSAVVGQERDRTVLTRAVVGSDDGHVLGNIGLHDLGRARAAEIGYWTAPWARRRGVAWRGSDLMTRWAHEHGIHRVELLADVANTASLAVAARAGFRPEGVLRDSHLDRAGGRTNMVLHSRLSTDPLPPPP